MQAAYDASAYAADSTHQEMNVTAGEIVLGMPLYLLQRGLDIVIVCHWRLKHRDGEQS